MPPFPDSINHLCRVMMFIDGENLAIRWKTHVGPDGPLPGIRSMEDVYVWNRQLNMAHHIHCEIVRKHYYASSMGDQEKLDTIHEELLALGMEAPRVFHRTKSRGSKRLDIQLSVEMLAHAHQDNYDAAVLVAGDEDYIPLVTAVKNTGKRVFLWSVQSGLSTVLRRSVDHFFDITPLLTDKNAMVIFDGR